MKALTPKFGWTEWFERQMKPILGVIGLFTALSGIAASWAADSAAVGACAAILIVLCAYNLLLWGNSRPRNPVVPALLETLRHRRRRQAIHVGSTVIGLACIAVIVMLSHEAWAVRGIRLAFGCDAVISRAERYVAGPGRTDFGERLELADCYDKLGRIADELKALEQLLSDQQALHTLSETDLRDRLGWLHAIIGLDLLTSFDSAVQTDAGLARQHLQQAAWYRRNDWFVLDLFAFATARAQRLHPTKNTEEARQILVKAQATFDSMSVPPTDADRVAHWHWQGRALLEIGTYEKAEKAFAEEQSLLPADGTAAATARGYQIEAEYDRTANLPALRRHLEEARTPADRKVRADIVVSAYLEEAAAADQQGDTARAAQAAKKAEDIWAIALQLGVEQDRVDRVRTALIWFYLGHYEDAVSMWRQIVKEEPANDFFWLLFGEAARRAQLLDDGRTALNVYTARRPDDPVGHAELGLAILGLAEHDGPPTQRVDLFRAAVDELSRAERLAPNDAVIPGLLRDAIIERAQAVEAGEAKIRSFEVALGWARKAREMQPANPDATRRLADLLNDLAYDYLLANGDLRTARFYVEECLKLQPNYAYALDTKATILIRAAEKSELGSVRTPLLQEADDLLERAIEGLPKGDMPARAELYVHKGRLAVLRGDDTSAQDSFHRALEFDSTNAEARKHLR